MNARICDNCNTPADDRASRGWISVEPANGDALQGYWQFEVIRGHFCRLECLIEKAQALIERRAFDQAERRIIDAARDKVRERNLGDDGIETLAAQLREQLIAHGSGERTIEVAEHDLRFLHNDLRRRLAISNT